MVIHCDEVSVGLHTWQLVSFFWSGFSRGFFIVIKCYAMFYVMLHIAMSCQFFFFTLARLLVLLLSLDAFLKNMFCFPPTQGLSLLRARATLI